MDIETDIIRPNQKDSKSVKYVAIDDNLEIAVYSQERTNRLREMIMARQREILEIHGSGNRELLLRRFDRILKRLKKK